MQKHIGETLADIIVKKTRSSNCIWSCYLNSLFNKISMHCLYMILVPHMILITRRLKYTNELTKCVITSMCRWWFSPTWCFCLCLNQMLSWYQHYIYLTCTFLYFFIRMHFLVSSVARCGHHGCFSFFFAFIQSTFYKHVTLAVWSALEKPTQGLTWLGGYMDEKCLPPRGQMFNPLL